LEPWLAVFDLRISRVSEVIAVVVTTVACLSRARVDPSVVRFAIARTEATIWPVTETIKILVDASGL
jgi:hypothetical protein